MFYIFGDVRHSTARKVIIVGCISISALILNYLYIKSGESKFYNSVLILIETIGNSFILIPSGGLNSPYVWYALNTILISAVKLDKKYCWLNLFVYLFNSTCMVGYILHADTNFIPMIMKESNLILSFILTTAVIILLSKYAKLNEEKNKSLLYANTELKCANEKIKGSINHIMDLYKSVQLFTSQENTNELLSLIIEYCKNVIKTDTVIFKSLENDDDSIIIKTEKRGFGNQFEKEMLQKWKVIEDSEKSFEIYIDARKYIFITIRNGYKSFGILGIDLTSCIDKNNEEDILEQLNVVANLSSTVLEKFHLQQVSEGLLINQEQNRIADEIHDSTLQRLFSTSCGIYETIKKLRKSNVYEIETELNTIRKSINNIMKELRETVYGLSWSKNGSNNFIIDIESYISEVRMLTRANIEFSINGNNELLSMEQKKAIYRVICEGIGNAIKHGKAKYIKVILSVEREHTVLELTDNGIGFDLNNAETDHKLGLGIKNMYNLIYSLNGTIELDSQLGLGTKINIEIPNNNNVLELYKEEVV